MTAVVDALVRLEDGQDLTATEAETVFDAMLSGLMPHDHMARFLLAFRAKTETMDEILGAARSMRAHMTSIVAPPDAMDIVGTGGDSLGTLNISTATALVVAACGVPVAKHGSRGVTSRSGASDVLAALGVYLDQDIAGLERTLAEAGIVFLFAPNHHPAMRHVAAVRKELGVRTIFNLLGPLTNPARVRRHLIGSSNLEWLGPMAEVLRHLGSERAWLVHGHDGMDEITTTAPTDVVELRDGQMRHTMLTPEDVGVPRAMLEGLRGGDAAQNAEAIHRLLGGELGPYRDIVCLNAAAALIVAGKSDHSGKAFAMAGVALSSGAARAKLAALVEASQKNNQTA